MASDLKKMKNMKPQVEGFDALGFAFTGIVHRATIENAAEQYISRYICSDARLLVSCYYRAFYFY